MKRTRVRKEKGEDEERRVSERMRRAVVGKRELGYVVVLHFFHFFFTPEYKEERRKSTI